VHARRWQRQTADRDSVAQPAVYDLLSAVDWHTGSGVRCNTSLNSKGRGCSDPLQQAFQSVSRRRAAHVKGDILRT
jgi:predicted NodU family carbamoyl transferase